jgi:hypothetical protein
MKTFDEYWEEAQHHVNAEYHAALEVWNCARMYNDIQLENFQEKLKLMADERDQVIDDLSRGRGELARKVVELEIALRIKTEEHDCCASDLLNFRQDAADIASIAMRKAWQLGQTYWQQADSDYVSHHRKAEATEVMFQALIDSARNQLMNMEVEDTP